MNTNILTTLCAFLRTAPALRDITLAAEQLPPAPFTAGLWGRGTAVKETRQNLWGEIRQSRRSEFVLRLCLPLTSGDDAAALQNVQRLETLQAWLAAHQVRWCEIRFDVVAVLIEPGRPATLQHYEAAF